MIPFGMHLLPTPELFWSAYLESPFTDCISCGSPLDAVTVYVVQKRFVTGEAVFEMAICDQCRQQLTDGYSEQTRNALNQEMVECFIRNSATVARMNEKCPSSSALLEHCMDHCLICSIDRRNCARYSLAGLFRRDEIVVQCGPIGQSPVMICDGCEERFSGLISQATRDAWNRFVDEHFDDPPGIGLDSPYETPVAF